MIILATAIILSLNGSGIIGKANEAKTSSDLANAKYVAALAKAEWDLMSESEQKSITGGFKSYAEDKLKNAGFKTGSGTDSYVISETGKLISSGKNTMYVGADNRAAIIPLGFTVSTIPGETTIDGGLVIYEGTDPVTNVDSDSNGIIDAQETRNQFVWVPVDDYSKFQRTTTYKSTEDITTPSSEYKEPVSVACSNHDYDNHVCIDTLTLSLTNDLTEEWKEEAAMRASVEANGGFYIGRYEAGTTVERKSNTDNKTTELVVQKDKFVYNCVAWGQSMTNIKGEVRASSEKNQGLGEVELSRNMYKNSTSVVSTLCYGVQWDAALRFIATKDPDYPTNSVGKGNYTMSLLEETGYYGINNIYDMAGNVAEWTMEADSTNYRVIRGGSYLTGGNNCPASDRNSNLPINAYFYYGFRPTLYIK